MHICVRHNRDLIPTPPNRYLDSSGFHGEHRVCPPAPRGPPPRQHRCLPPPPRLGTGTRRSQGIWGFPAPFCWQGGSRLVSTPPKNNAGNALGWLHSAPGVPGGGHSSCAAFRIQPKSPHRETPGKGRPRGLLVAGRFRALVSFAFVQSLFFLVLFCFFLIIFIPTLPPFFLERAHITFPFIFLLAYRFKKKKISFSGV